MDVTPHDRWRGVVRVGHLGDIQSRIALADLTFVARPALQILVGQVYVASLASSATRTSLTRAGATWLPVRGRLTIENRVLVERRRTTALGSSMRGRNRLRITGSRPGGVPIAASASLETIVAAGSGLVENRIQVGGTRALGRLSIEGYWLQRRLHASAVVNGAGLTASWRIGK